MDILALVASIIVIISLSALIIALFTQRTNATGVWAKVIQIAQVIDNLPLSGALFTAMRSPEFITLVIAFVVFASVAVNPALAGMQNQLFIIIFGGWSVLWGRITISDWLTGKYGSPSNPADSLDDVGKQMLNDLIAAALPMIIAGSKTNAPVTINATVSPSVTTVHTSTAAPKNVSAIS